MDELSEEDKLTVARARKIQRFLSQPFQVAEVFTGHLGKLVPLKETIEGFKNILGGRMGCHINFGDNSYTRQALQMINRIFSLCSRSIRCSARTSFLHGGSN